MANVKLTLEFSFSEKDAKIINEAMYNTPFVEDGLADMIHAMLEHKAHDLAFRDVGEMLARRASLIQQDVRKALGAN